MAAYGWIAMTFIQTFKREELHGFIELTWMSTVSLVVVELYLLGESVTQEQINCAIEKLHFNQLMKP